MLVRQRQIIGDGLDGLDEGAEVARVEVDAAAMRRKVVRHRPVPRIPDAGKLEQGTEQLRAILPAVVRQSGVLVRVVSRGTDLEALHAVLMRRQGHHLVVRVVAEDVLDRVAPRLGDVYEEESIIE
jgi:hypothetical protein